MKGLTILSGLFFINSIFTGVLNENEKHISKAYP
jgi:preprotein translocase subunit SecG